MRQGMVNPYRSLQSLCGDDFEILHQTRETTLDSGWLVDTDL
jgi:hypothetical protein